jgi:hypothetical protein
MSAPLTAAERLVREVLVAHWAVAEQDTPAARRVYNDALNRALSNPSVTTEVLKHLASVTANVVATLATEQDIELADALPALFRELDASVESLCLQHLIPARSARNCAGLKVRTASRSREGVGQTLARITER